MKKNNVVMMVGRVTDRVAGAIYRDSALSVGEGDTKTEELLLITPGLHWPACILGKRVRIYGHKYRDEDGQDYTKVTAYALITKRKGYYHALKEKPEDWSGPWPNDDQETKQKIADIMGVL